MAIEFKHGGQVWRADTVDEAIELRKKLQEEDKWYGIDGGESPWDEEGPWTPDTMSEFLQAIGENQRALLRALFSNNDGVTSGELVETLKLGSEVALAGVLSGLSKQLKKLGIKTWNLYTVQVHWKLKTKTRVFKLSFGFRWAAQEFGWPENWT